MCTTGAIFWSTAWQKPSSAFRASLGALPEATRAQAPALIQQVAGAEAPAVAAVLGPAAMAPALYAFMAGYRLSLTVAGTLLIGVLNNILSLNGVNSDIQLLITGFVIVVVAGLQRLRPAT